ncbi:MAG: hypothetical protein LBT39_08130 [Treponema sp.]|jgi:hypothetical protein|nr:hypothetical protein [Treponema sp.]
MKKKTLTGVIFGLLVMVTLGAQGAKPKLVVRNLTGGSGSDGKNITAMLANQALIRENFILVAEDEDPDYVISGEIRRTGLSYTASFIMTDAKTNKELATERFVYRDSLEIAAYIPAIALNLSSAAQPDLVWGGSIIPLPEPPPAPETPVIVEAPPPVVEVAPPVVVQVEPPKPAPVPAPVAPPAPEAPPAPPASEEKLLHIGAWVGFSPLGGETEYYSHYSSYYSKDFDNGDDGAYKKASPVGFGLELDLRPSEHWGFKAVLMGSSMSQERKARIPSNGGYTTRNFHRAGYGMIFAIAPEFIFEWFGMNGAYLGVAAHIKTHDWDNDSRHSTDTAFGLYTGLEGEILKLGSGQLFVTVNAAFLYGTADDDPKDPTPITWNPYGKLEKSITLNIGIGYRFGFIAKKSK